MASLDRVQRFRLILGKTAEASLCAIAGEGATSLGQAETEIDEALDQIYAIEEERPEGGEKGERQAGLGRSAPRLAKCLGDIRSYFPRDVVAVIQQDAIERKGLTQLLFEPETLGQVTPSI